LKVLNELKLYITIYVFVDDRHSNFYLNERHIVTSMELDRDKFKSSLLGYRKLC